MTPPLHPDIAMLEPLLGTWRGEGDGEYPTIEPFGYVETISFGHAGKPFLSYQQRTVATDDGRPLHAEAGFVRAPTKSTAELVLAHPTGVAELAEGTIESHGGRLVIQLRSYAIGRTATAKDVETVERTIEVSGDELAYTLRMAAVGVPLTHHLAATLRRLPPDERA